MTVVACAIAVPATQVRPIAAQTRRSFSPESEKLQSGAEEDLKGSSSYGYGYYGGGYGGGYGGYGGYGSGYGGYGAGYGSGIGGYYGMENIFSNFFMKKIANKPLRIF